MWPATTLSMPSSDRLFRALARDEPEVIAALLRRLSPELLPAGAQLTPVDVSDPRIDLLFIDWVEVDWVTHLPPRETLHLDGQGYRDATFPERLYRYSLGLSLRFPERNVHTIGLWFRRPSPRERTAEIRRGGITVRVTMLILPEIAAESLLEDPLTACFAAGADPGGLSTRELCARVSAALPPRASGRQRSFALVAAAFGGRYMEMMDAFQKAGEEPVVYEEFCWIFHERGLEQGLEKGRLVEARAALQRVLARRGLAVGDSEQARIEACADLGQLERWLDEAVVAASAAEALA